MPVPVPADPFNVEPPLPELWRCGFLTPASLHYVRNHGVRPHPFAEAGCDTLWWRLQLRVGWEV